MKKNRTADRASLAHLQKQRQQLARLESLPYSENLRSVMDPEVFTCQPDARVKTVVREMAGRGISSVIVVDDQGRPSGILTDKDVVRRIVAADNVDPARVSVAEVMTPEPATLRPDNTIYRALSLLASRGIKHLPLIENQRLVGIVTLRQLLKLKYPEPMALIEGIIEARDTAELRAIKARLVQLAAHKLEAGIRALDIVTMLSLINRDLHRKTFELAMAHLGEPPCPVCLYVTGSHGRLENLLTPDQDHGLIIDDADPELPYDPYFMHLTETFSLWLDEVGFMTCPGYVMSSNPIWRKGLSEWQEQIHYWFARQVRELGRFATVLFDATPIWGVERLFNAIQDTAYDQLSQHHEVLRILHEEQGRHRVPTGFFGRFITEKSGEHRGELNVKQSGLLFVVESVRILALMKNIRETSTLKRLEQLVAGGHVHPDDGEYFAAAYQVLLHFALRTQLDKALAGRTIDSFLKPAELSAHDRETLRHAYKAVSALQELVATEFGELVL